MQMPLFSALPAAPGRSLGIGSAARAAGTADAEAAATAFAGILAAAAPAATIDAALPDEPATAAPAATPTEAAGAMPVDATAGAAEAKAAVPASGTATSEAPVVTPGADASAAAVAPPANPLAEPAGDAVSFLPGAVSGTANAAMPITSATTTDAPVTPAMPAVAAAAVPAATVPAATPAESAVTPTATAEPVVETMTSIPAGTEAQPATSEPIPAPAVTPGPGSVTVLHRTASPAAPATDIPADHLERPVALMDADQAHDTRATAPAVSGPADELDADAALRDGLTGEEEPAPADAESATSDEPEAAAPADPKPAALQALLGLGLQSYLKAGAFVESRPLGMAMADAFVDVESGDEQATGTTLSGRPAAFAAAVDSALAGLAGDGDSTTEDTLLALTRGGAGRISRASDPAAAIRSQVSDQITRSLASNPGEQKLSIRLDPENLGRVDVDFSAADDHLTIVLRASTPEAEQALRSGARELTDGILDRAARYQHVEVRVELREGATVRSEKQDERQQDQHKDGRQDAKDGRRDGREDGRGRRSDDGYDGARAAWARAMADLSQEV